MGLHSWFGPLQGRSFLERIRKSLKRRTPFVFWISALLIIINLSSLTGSTASLVIRLAATTSLVVAGAVWISPGRTARDSMVRRIHNVPRDRKPNIGTPEANIEHLRILALSIAHPESIRDRVHEEFILERYAINHDVMVEISIPNHLKSRVDIQARQNAFCYMTVVMLEPASMPDRIEVFDSKNGPLQVIKHDEYLGLVYVTLTSLIRAAYGLGPSSNIPASVEAEVEIAVQSMAHPSRKYSGPEIDAANMFRIDGSGDSELGEVQLKALMLARDLTRALSAAVPVIARIPMEAEGTFGVRYNEVVPYRLATTSRLRATLSILAGSGPTSISLVLSNLGTARNYELLVHAPDGYYLRTQDFASRDLTTNADEYYFRLRRRDGLPRAYVYGELNTRDPKQYANPTLSLSFAEIPPGKSLSAAIAAISCAALVWLVGLTTSRGSGIVGTDAPAFLLSFPAIAATWLSFDRPTKRLSEGPLSVQASLILTLAFSLISASLSVLTQAKVNFISNNFFHHVTFLGIIVPSWIFMSIISLTNAIFIGAICLRDTLSYARLISGTGPAESN